MKTISNKSGMALPTALVFMAIVGITASAFLVSAHTSLRMVIKWREADQCFLLAQEALEFAKQDIVKKFRDYYNSPFLSGTEFRWTRLNWFAQYGSCHIGYWGSHYSLPNNKSLRNGKYSVRVDGYRDVSRSQREVIIRVNATVGDSKRQISEVVRFGLAPSRVFDYAYFINNFGWFYGNTITAHGDVRANGNFDCQSSPLINGDVFASVNPFNGAAGTATGSWRYKTLAEYYSSAPRLSRPGSPTSAGGEEWPMGYPGTAKTWQWLDSLEMPYLGDLAEYEYLATFETGMIRQGSVTLVTNVYAGPGPDGVANTADDGTVILVGTSSDPIEVKGPVVVRGDVIIKGVVKGQGTIYAGRNMHIVGNITRKNDPSWTKPDNNPDNNVNQNSSKDFLGLAAKGNIIMGDYTSSTWRDRTAYYMKPNFTKPYTTDASDYNLGYDSDRNTNNGYVFNGNYTALDGGTKLDNNGNTVTNRRYYESCISTGLFGSIARTAAVNRVDAVLYNNHLVTGYVPGGFTNNGAIVSRDEAIIFTGSVTFNWDIRMGSEAKDAEGMVDLFYLPRTLAHPETRYWREGPPG